MLDGRFNSNFSPLGIILNLLSTRSFSDSVDELGDHLDVKYKDEEGDLFLFSCLYFDFFSLFLLECFISLEFVFLFLDLFYLSCLLFEEISGFSDAHFAD